MNPLTNIVDTLNKIKEDVDNRFFPTAQVLAEPPEQPTDEPLATGTANYVNDLNRETYGDEAEIISTTGQLKQANLAAAINAAQEAYDLSIDRDSQAVVEGKLTPYQMQRNALLRSEALLKAEEDPSFGLALENMDQLTMQAATDNPDIQVEDPDYTADYNRIIINKNMLMQARKELVPYGIVENLMTLGSVPAAIIHGSKGAAEEEAKKAEGFFGNLAQVAWNFVPFYEEDLVVSGLPKELGKISVIPHVNELAYFTYWQDAIDKDSNQQFRDRLSKYIQYCKDKGLMDTEIDQLLGKITDPSPILEDLGFAFDLLWLVPKLKVFSKMTQKAYEATMRVLRGTNKQAASNLISTLEEATKTSSKIDVGDIEKVTLKLQDSLREAEVIGDARPKSSINLNPQIPGVDITEIGEAVAKVSKGTGKSVVETDVFGSLKAKDIADFDANKSWMRQNLMDALVKAPMDMKSGVAQKEWAVKLIKDSFGKRQTPSIKKNVDLHSNDWADLLLGGNHDSQVLMFAESEKDFKEGLKGWLWNELEMDTNIPRAEAKALQKSLGDRVKVAVRVDGGTEDVIEKSVSVEVPFSERTYIPTAKKATTLEEFLASKPSHEMVELPDDLSTELGRLKAARDTKGATRSLLKTVKEADPSDPTRVRVVSNDYFDSVAKGTITKDNLAHIEDVVDEKNYRLVLGRAINAFENFKQVGLSGRKEELLKQSVNSLADSLDASNNLYRTTGISDILRTKYNDVVQETSQGDLFALVRSNKTYKTRGAADKARKALKAEDSWSIPLPGGRWGVDVKIPLSDGFGMMAKKDSLNLADNTMRHIGSSAIFTSTSKPTYIRHLDELRELEAANIREFGESVQRSRAAVKGPEKDVLDAMLNEGIMTGSWRTPDYVADKLSSQAARDAYNGTRLLNDLDYLAVNNARRDTLVRDGWKVMHFNNESLGYAKILRKTPEETLSELKSTTRKIIMGDPSIAPQSFADLGITEERMKQLVKDGWVIVERTFGPNEFTKAKAVYYFLDGHSLVESDVPQIVTNYVAGGRRFFDRAATYAKQLVIEADETGKEFITGVQTIASDVDSIGFAQKVGKIEQVRKEVAQMGDFIDNKRVSDLINRLGLTDVPFKDAESFIAWCQKHGVDYKHLDNVIAPLRNGEMLPSYARVKDSITSAVSDEDMLEILHRSPYQAYTKEAQMQKWHRSGKDILSWNFEDYAKPVDFDKNLRYIVNDMINSQVMQPYSDMMANVFAKRWGDKVKGFGNMSAKQMLNGVHKMSDFSEDSLETSRALIFAKNYRVIRNIPSDWDADLAKGFNKVLQVARAGTPKEFEDIAHGVALTAKRVADWGPQKQARHIASSVWLGFLNTKQLITQIAPITYVALMKPASFAKGFRKAIPLTYELITSKGSWSKATERFLKSEKLYTPETKALWRSLIDARIFENTIYAGALETADAGSKWSKIDRVNFATKNFSEVANRVIAYTTAYEELGFGAKGINTAKDMAAFRSLGNTLYMNMSPTSLARIQSTETGKTLSQFMSAHFRFWETLLFDKNLTRDEKIRLGLGILGMTGIRGFVGVEGARRAINWTKDIYNYFRPETIEEKTYPVEEETAAERILDAGILGYISGSEGYNWSSFISLPATQLIEGFSDILSDPISNIPAVAAATSIRNTVQDAFRAIAAYNHSRDSYEGWRESLKVMATTPRGIPGIKQKFAAATVWTEGKMWGTNGQLIYEDAKTLDKVMSLFGMPRMSSEELTAAYIDSAHEREKIDEYVKETKRLWNLWVDSHNDSYWEEIRMLEESPMLNEAQKVEAFKQLQKSPHFDTIQDEKNRRIIKEMKEPHGGTYMLKLDNLERK